MKLINIKDAEYPQLLKSIRNAPQILYTEGKIQCLNMPCVTVVGSRNMSDYGKSITQKLVRELVAKGVCIVSGLAVGIDTVAHQTCIENGGRTIAVLGSGLNKVFPKENRGLYDDIVNSGGCVISEHEPDTEAQKIFFPARNRIVSGLSLGTLVIEATYRSGTSITAKFAFEQNRKVFCIPNSVGSKNSSGTINLIKKGARLITEANEVLQEIGLFEKTEDIEKIEKQQQCRRMKILEEEELDSLGEIAKQIYAYIKENRIANIEVMCSELKISVQDVNTYLSILELKGLILNKSAGRYTLRNEMYI